MVREVVTVQVGQCGNQIGTRFWNLALQEHVALAAHPAYDAPLSTFFRNVDTRRSPPISIPLADGQAPIATLKARAVLVDMEEGVVSHMLRSPLAELFDRRLILTDISGAGNNWAHGHEVYGPQHRGSLLERVRRAVGDVEGAEARLQRGRPDGQLAAPVGVDLGDDGDAHLDLGQAVRAVVLGVLVRRRAAVRVLLALE